MKLNCSQSESGEPLEYRRKSQGRAYDRLGLMRITGENPYLGAVLSILITSFLFSLIVLIITALCINSSRLGVVIL